MANQSNSQKIAQLERKLAKTERVLKVVAEFLLIISNSLSDLGAPAFQFGGKLVVTHKAKRKNHGI